MRHLAHMPNIAENLSRRGLQHVGQFTVMLPRAPDCGFIYRQLCRSKVRTRHRDIGLRVIQAHIALALLLRIVERMRVQEGPDKLAADVFQPKLEVRVLIYGVVAAEIGAGTDHYPLLVGDFFVTDQTGRIAGSGRGDSGIKGVRERISQRHPRRAGFYLEFRRGRRLVLVRGHWHPHCTPEPFRENKQAQIKKPRGRNPGAWMTKMRSSETVTSLRRLLASVRRLYRRTSW